MGIRKQLAAHDARFISFDDLLSAVAEAEGVSVAETARHMSINGVLNGATHRLRNWVNGSYAEGCGDAADYLIESAIHPDKKIWISDAAQNEMNAGEPGFFRDEIAGTLSACGIAIPTCLQSSAAQAKPAEAAKAVPAPPQQKLAELLPFVQRVNVTLNEAADLLAEANGGRWYAALEDAADSGQVQAGTWSVDRGEQPLSHADLRAWCEAGGFIWPVPLPPAPTAIEKLFQATQENGRSTIELDILRQELEAVTKERDELRATVVDLEDRYDLEMKLREVGRVENCTERQRSAELAAEVERLRGVLEAAQKLQDTPEAAGCTVTIPHTTRGLEVLFSVMREHWMGFPPEHPPKSSTVASAIDAAMGRTPNKNGLPSRNAETLAALIRPDEIADADPRNARRR